MNIPVINSTRRVITLVLSSIVFVLIAFPVVCGELSAYCNKCKNRGKLDTDLPEDFKNLPFKSSAVIEYKTGCCGLGWIPCTKKDCTKREEAEKEFEQLTAPLKAWVAERRRDVEEKAFANDPKLKGTRAMYVDTKHFHLAGTFKKRLVKYIYKGMEKKKEYDPIHSIHLYAERVEEIYSRFCKLFEIQGEHFPKMTDKWTILIWETEKQQNAASFAFCNFTNSAGASIEAVIYTTWDGDDDLYLHHKIANAISNLMTEDYAKIVEYFPVWLKEAIAHWIEYDIFGELRIFTTGEVDFDPSCPTRKLKSNIKGAVKRKDRNLRPLSEYMDKNIMDIKGWDRLKGWSIVDWLLNGVKNNSVNKLVTHFKENYEKNNKRQTPSFQAILSMNSDELDEAWATWVLENYPDEEED